MGACFGDGLLGFIHEDLQDVESQVVYLEQFAALGLSHKFREIVGTRVLEVAYKKGGIVEKRWLSDKEAAPVLAAQREIGGSAPYSMFPECLNNQLYIPGCRSGSDGIVQWPGSSMDGWGFRPMRNAIAGLTEWIASVENGELKGDVDFLRKLLRDLELASNQRLIFAIGY
jgi:hypothetical protein